MSEITKFESAHIANISDFVQIKDEHVYTTSRIVAEKFGKEHKHVIRDIEELIKNMVQPIENIGKTNFGLSENKAQLKFEVSENIENIREVNFDFSEYFVPDEYKIEGQTRTYKQYLITEKGAMLLIMGFTGEKAFAIKTKFIDEFARMKNIINNPAQVIAETGSLDALVAFGVTNQRFTNALVKAKQEQQLLEQQKREAENELVAQKAIFYDRIVPGIKGMHRHIFNLTNERDEAIADYEGLYNTFIDNSSWSDMREVSAILNINGLGRNKLFQLLRDKGVLDNNNVPYRKYVDNGYFKLADAVRITKKGKMRFNKVMVSQSGKVFIEKLARKG